MKILLADFHKYIGYSGGIEHVLSDMAVALDHMGHTVTCVFWDEKEGEPFFKMPDTVNIINLCHYEGRNISGGFLLKAVREIVRPFSQSAARNVNYNMLMKGSHALSSVLDTEKPDVIISFREPTGRVLLSGLKTEIPVISMLHNDPDEILEKAPEEEKEALLKSRAVQVLLPSYIEKAKKHLSYDHFIAIPNAVKKSNVIAEVAEEKKQHVITNVGRVTGRTKRQHLLVEAFADLAKDFPDWIVNIWGATYDKAYIMKLKKLISDKDLEDRVFLKGTTSHMDEVWKETDIFAFPSHHEGFPLALTEAMAAGIPAVGFRNCPAVNELIKDGKSGFLTGNTVEDFGTALRDLMKNPELRGKFGEEARKEMEEYSPQHVWQMWDSLIKKTVSNKQ